MEFNFFDFSQYYRQLIVKNNILNFEKKEIKGKSLVCIFLTRFCNVGCSFCFFKSPPAWSRISINDQFNDDGINKFILFTKEANLGYILVSGGGEPLSRKKHILKIIEEAVSNRIVLVTSGSWALNYNVALSYIEDMYKSLCLRNSPTTLVLRVSVSSYHATKLGIQCAENIINIFNKYFSNTFNFLLQIKTFEKDQVLDKLLAKINGYVDRNNIDIFKSDNEILEKKIPRKLVATLPSGYKFNIGFSKVFYSSIKPDLNNIDVLKVGIGVFEEDLKFCENYNSTLVYNTDNTEGIDWSIGYNGNICTWQNQSQDHYKNLYVDNSYEEIKLSYLQDPLTYSVIDKGNVYRDNVIGEVNPKAVLRAKAMGLRDCVGAILFEEEKTRLYYSIRVTQDYIKEKAISITNIKKFPQLLQDIIFIKPDELVKLYFKSKHNIIAQQKNRYFNEIEWYDLFELIKLGHYDLTANEIDNAITYYNERADEKISKLSDIKEQGGEIIKRLTERLIAPRTIDQQKN